MQSMATNPYNEKGELVRSELYFIKVDILVFVQCFVYLSV